MLKILLKKIIETNSVLSDNSLYDDFGIVTPYLILNLCKNFMLKLLGLLY